MVNRFKILENLSLRKLVTMGFLLCAYWGFIYFSWDAINEFRQEKTGLNQMLLNVNELPLPTITVCSTEMFKNANINETKKDELLSNLSNHVFAWNDFFDQSFLERLGQWNPHEIFSSRLGVCFSLNYDKNLTLNTPDNQSRWQFLIGKKYQVSFFKMVITILFSKCLETVNIFKQIEAFH